MSWQISLSCEFNKLITPIFPNRLLEISRKKPNNPAVYLIQNSSLEKTITYDALYHGAVSYARSLENRGITPGEVVIIILNHCEELIFAFWGAILHGAIPAIMPFLTEKLSPDHYRNSLISLIEITAPAAIITYPEFLPEVNQALKSFSKRSNPIRATINISEIIMTSDLSATSLAGFSRQQDDIVLLQHSSGSTGLQKGVALSHQSVFNQLESYTKAIALSEEDIIVSWLPLYHDMGLIAGFILPILYGIPLVLISPFDWVRSPALLLQAITKYKGTLSWLPNFAFNFCSRKIRSRELENVNLASLRAIINCSEPMYISSHQLFQERFSAYGLKPNAIATCYAMAENVFGVTQGGIESPVIVDLINPVDFASEHRAQPAKENMPSISFVSAGKPIENVEVKILSADQKALPDRAVGEVAIRSNCLLKEYYNRPDLTESIFFGDWYLTGDLGYIAKGELFITGRKKDLIIVGGKNIYPQDLEKLANEVDGIHQGRVVAFGIFNQESGTEDIIIMAELDEGIPLDPAVQKELSNQIRLKINHGSDVSVRYVKFVPHGWLLKTSSGKVARASNKEKFLVEFENEF